MFSERRDLQRVSGALLVLLLTVGGLLASRARLPECDVACVLARGAKRAGQWGRCTDVTALVRQARTLVDAVGGDVVEVMKALGPHLNATEPHALGEVIAAAMGAGVCAALESMPPTTLRQGLFHGIVWQTVLAARLSDNAAAWRVGFEALCRTPRAMPRRHFLLDCAHPMGHAAALLALHARGANVCGAQSVVLTPERLRVALDVCAAAPATPLGYDCAQGVFHHYAEHGVWSVDEPWWFPCGNWVTPYEAPCYRMLFDRGITYRRLRHHNATTNVASFVWAHDLCAGDVGCVFGRAAALFPLAHGWTGLTHFAYTSIAPTARNVHEWCEAEVLATEANATRSWTACVVGAAHMITWMAGNYRREPLPPTLGERLCIPMSAHLARRCRITLYALSSGEAPVTWDAMLGEDTLWHAEAWVRS